MGQVELTQKVLDRLKKQIAFGGMTKRKTTEGEVILKCPAYNGQGNLMPLASDLTKLFIDYVENASLKQIKNILKDILQSP